MMRKEQRNGNETDDKAGGSNPAFSGKDDEERGSKKCAK